MIKEEKRLQIKNGAEPSLKIEEVLKQPKATPSKDEEYSTRPEVNQENGPNVQIESHQNIHAHIYNYGSIVGREPEIREVIIVEPGIAFIDPYPSLYTTTAWILLIVNLLIPGLGTGIVGCLVDNNSGYFILTGIFQFLTAIFIIGYILAIWTSAILIMKAK